MESSSTFPLRIRVLRDVSGHFLLPVVIEAQQREPKQWSACPGVLTKRVWISTVLSGLCCWTYS